MSTPRVGHKVLILAGDPMLAALLGGLVEVAHLEPAFAAPDEHPVDALARVKPIVAILVDALNAEAENDLFVARARKRNVEVLMFGTAGLVRKRRAWAEEQNVPLFELPRQVDELQQALNDLREPDQRQRPSRRQPHTERDQEGTLIFDDGKGTRWSVYDRRTQKRRRDSVERQFVNEEGSVLQCDVSEDEAASTSVDKLSQQLARARPLRAAEGPERFTR